MNPERQSDGRPRVRGSDFTAYRVGGAIAAVLLLVVLVAQTWEVFDSDARTVPEVGWTATAESGAGILASQVLRRRTLLQAQRDRSGPSPEGAQQGFKIDDGILLIGRPIDEPTGMLTETWLRPTGDTVSLLGAPREIVGSTSLPYLNAALFERPAGRDWRHGIADIATHLGAYLILGFAFVLALILAIRGRVPIAEGISGRSVKRFGFIERANHWMTSISFLMLALTGIILAYGRTLILPFGDEILGDAGWFATWGHAIFFPSFALGILVMVLLWAWRNVPTRLDFEWLRRGGGFFSDSSDNPPARKFNAGQKLVYWSAVLGGLLMVGTGVLLLFPFWFLDVDAMSWVMLSHAIVALFMIAIFIGHIYIGTVGMQGAFWAMWSGKVDRNWAKEHHELWLKEIEKGGS
ncbi:MULTISPECIES: formate dehydrogenase subunit gamma [unclassified Salipiger]|uniref:formate dehydrogenase subunit gamma n=1 Tax=unclassified Salipiger TaxID=2640570 RepID=UPI0013BAFE1E|nr:MULTISPECIES: formate dehydrogenase subunit gamma [unclassified Salipiger]NDV52559.1 formate dehydrogenase subunit gamma [Salipiger sp. PrR003]NDW32728.1 formate dehydrogenase subunit gamma [Salipiger sp. PrR007]